MKIPSHQWGRCSARWRKRIPLLSETGSNAEAVFGLMSVTTVGLLDDVTKVVLVPGILIVAHGLAGWRRAETPTPPPGTKVTAFPSYPTEKSA